MRITVKINVLVAALHVAVSKEDHNDADCLCIAVSTHSFSDNYIYAKDFIYPTDYLSEPFSRCPSLAGKPKLFFISVCVLLMYILEVVQISIPLV